MIKKPNYKTNQMKSLRYIFTVLVVIALTGTMSCHKKNPPPSQTDQQKKAEMLAGTWTTTSVDKLPTGVDKSIISDLAITFNVDSDNNPTTFSASGATDFFATQSSSTWSFSGNSTSVINLSNVSPVTTITVNSVTDTKLVIQFTYVTQRTMKLDGDYQLTMGR